MSTIKILAIDDEPLALQQLAAYIRKIPYFELVDSCASAAEAREVMNREAIDAIFIDINMPDLNGLEFVRSLLAPPLVVFTTAYSEYAIDGFKVNALHYLLKPFSMDEFRQAAEKVRRQMQLINGSAQAGASVSTSAPTQTQQAEADTAHSEVYEADELPAEQADSNAIYLKTDYKVVRVDVNDIRYVESMGSYLRFHLKGQARRPIMALLTMKKIETRLPSTMFMRIHRSYIINLHDIHEVNRNQVVLEDQTSLPLGDLYRDQFNAYLNSHFLGR